MPKWFVVSSSRRRVRLAEAGQAASRLAVGLVLLLVVGFAGYVIWYSVTHPGR